MFVILMKIQQRNIAVTAVAAGVPGARRSSSKISVRSASWQAATVRRSSGPDARPAGEHQREVGMLRTIGQRQQPVSVARGWGEGESSTGTSS